MASTAPPTEIGFVSIGNMGCLMSKHSKDKGHTATVFELDKSAVDDLVKNGAKAASSVADIGESCQRVSTRLPALEIIERTYSGSNGLLSRASLSTVFIDSSIMNPGSAEVVHKVAAAAKGIKFFDAPVAGAVLTARAGTQVFMVGGDKKEIKELLDLQECLHGHKCSRSQLDRFRLCG